MKTKYLIFSALTLLALSVSACGGNESSGNNRKSNSQDSSNQGSDSSQPQGDDPFIFDDEKLEEVQEIHTDNQKAYLEFSNEYYSMTSADLNGFEARGDSNDVSAPKPVKLEWDFDPVEGKTLTRYSVVYGQKADLSDGYEVVGTTAKSLTFYNPYLGTNYFKVVANYSDGDTEESQIRTFKVTEQAPRNLKVGNMANCRDMGGRTTYAGGKIKQGLIYRTCGNKFDYNSVINDEGKKVMLEQLGVKTEINVSDNDTYNFGSSLLPGTQLENCYMNYGSTPYSNLARNSSRIRQVMNILADEDNYPVFYHCRIGTDRTGITGVMIGGLLGIEFNDIIQDYLFSNFAPIDGQRYPGKTPDNNGDDIKKYIDEIIALPGDTFQEKAYLALRVIGVPAAQLDAIIDIMTDGAKAEIPDTFKVGAGNDLTSTGTKKTDTTFMNPDIYYEVAANKSASYSVTTTQGKKDVILYMASTNTSISTSTSTTLGSSITLKIDGAEQTMEIASRTLHRCGFGQTAQNTNKRLGYMFNILGNYDFTAGAHTVEIAVKSGTFNVASIAVADRPAA